MTTDSDQKSKNQIKRELKRQRWEETKHERRKEEKRRRKENRAKRIAAGLSVAPKRKQIPTDQERTSHTIVLDCAFNDKMKENELKSVYFNLTSNKKPMKAVNLVASSFDGELRILMDKTCGEYSKWTHIEMDSKPMQERFDSSQMVYLTADSPNVITTLDPQKVYVIGALVDRNRHKELCYKKALDLQMETAQLPIGDHLKLKSRRILAVNHVFEILSSYLHQNDWKAALDVAIPGRKKAASDISASKSQTSNSSDEHSDQQGEETATSQYQ